jgi:hypothetical protein
VWASASWAQILLPKHLRHRCPTVARVWQEPKAKEIILTMNKEEAKMVAPRTIIADLKVAYHPLTQSEAYEFAPEASAPNDH